MVADQVMVEIEPAVMVVGEAVNVITGGPGLTVIVTGGFEVTVPPGPVAVRTYVAVAVALNVTDPLTANAVEVSARGSGDKVTEVAFAVVQVRVTGVPATTPFADGENELMLGGCWGCG